VNQFTRQFYNKNTKAIADAVAGCGDPLKAVGLTAPSGYRVEYDADKCVLCETCAGVCSFGAVEVKDGRRIWDELACVGCDLCVEHCPQGALKLVLPETAGFIPLDMDLVKSKLR
jgi:heterodisulfide reductase subunit A-like polyferredoxin